MPKGNPFTTEMFIEKCRHIHGDRYDYSLVEYKNAQEKVKIICLAHGVFVMYAKHHTRGHGCPECGKISTGKKKRLDLPEFLTKAKSIHGDRYDYSLVVYETAKVPVEIICPIHGSFWQTPDCHIGLKESGCSKCSGMFKKDTQYFIEQAKLIHGDTYDYSKVVYQTVKDQVEIICRMHGSFLQTPDSHLNTKSGCPRCVSLISDQETAWLNHLGIPNDPTHRQVYLRLDDGSRIHADGYVASTNTIYEYYGDYYHGNPNVYDHRKMNTTCKKTFGELHERTIKREERILRSGYKLVTMWEAQWKSGG